MANITFSDAVKALASGIKNKRTSFERSEKIEIAKDFLSVEEPKKHPMWNNIELDLDQNSISILREYSSELHSAYNSGIAEETQQVFEKVDKSSELLENLHQEIETALGEARELETIANRLQDSNIGKIAGKEQHQLNNLGEKLERIDQEGRELEKEKEKIEGKLRSHGIDGKALHDTLERRAKTAGKIIQKASDSISNSGDEDKGKDWKQILVNPSSHIQPDENLDIEQDELVPYIEQGDTFSWSTHPNWNISHDTPRQGFKFHITATPDEGYEVCRELIPILQAEEISHKIIWEKDWMEHRIKNKGDIQAMKLMTIYPEVLNGSKASQEFYVGRDQKNRDEFFKNQKNTVEILNYILSAADNSVINGGPKLEGKRDYFSVEFQTEELRVKNTRLHLTYSHLGHPPLQVVKNGRKYSLEDYVLKKDKNGDFIQINHSPYYEVADQNFRESGEYRENGNYDSSDYFLSHLLSRKKAKEVKKGIGGKFGQNTYQEDVIIGLDGKIAGAHYLPPPEGIQRIKQILSNL